MAWLIEWIGRVIEYVSAVPSCGQEMDVWSASSVGISFVITFASPTGPGFHGRRGFLASWRPLHSSTGAVEVIGSPFNTLADAEGACNAKLGELEHNGG
jgi:hypothetical protein